jgi:hypothetical protein
MTNRTLILCLLIAVGTVGGCMDSTVPMPDHRSSPAPSFVTKYNATAQRVERLWAYAKLRIVFREKPSDLGFPWGSASKDAEPNARLLVVKRPKSKIAPADVLLIIKEASQEMGRVGLSATDKVAYSWLNAGSRRSCVYAEIENLDRMEINPLELLSAAGILPIAAPSSRLPAATKRLSEDRRAAIISAVEYDVNAGYPVLRREYYFDRLMKVERTLFDKTLTPLPVRVSKIKHFDLLGRCVATTTIDEYSKMELDKSGEEVELPSHFTTEFHTSGTTLEIRLEGMTDEDRVDDEAFLFYKRLPPGLKPTLLR